MRSSWSVVTASPYTEHRPVVIAQVAQTGIILGFDRVEGHVAVLELDRDVAGITGPVERLAEGGEGDCRGD
jgi:hypothetical protein